MQNGLGIGMHNIFRLSDAKSRSICAENFTGEKGEAGKATEGTGAFCARELGQGWKVSPSIVIEPDETFTLADIKGQGAIKHIWFTDSRPHKDSDYKNRRMILRMYWDNSDIPSVEVPYNDFFACSDNYSYAPLISLPVTVTPNRSYNCFWEMPFRSGAKITLQNITDDNITVYYQINYTLCDVPDDAAYFHAQFRKTKAVKQGSVHTILDNVKGKGQYVGTYMYWKTAREGWWGEGETKFYLDGDTDFPTICSTGTEDYFLGSYNFDVNDKYTPFCTPYSGLSKINHPNDGAEIPDSPYRIGQSFSLYRWHIADAIFFNSDIKVTQQALGWQSGGRYYQLKDEISTVAYWYMDSICSSFPSLPNREDIKLEY